MECDDARESSPYASEIIIKIRRKAMERARIMKNNGENGEKKRSAHAQRMRTMNV